MHTDAVLDVSFDLGSSGEVGSLLRRSSRPVYMLVLVQVPHGNSGVQ